jgi:hypothetical protein
MARTFNGTTDGIGLSPGACATLNGAITIAAIAKVAAYPSALACIWGADTATEIGGYMLVINNEGYPVLATQSASAGLFLGKAPLAEWALLVATKASGTSAVTTYTYKLPSETWLGGEPGAGTLANPSLTATTLGVGAREPAKARYFNGALAVIGVWGSVLSAEQLHTLVRGASSYLSKWEALAPAGLWAFNQALTSEAVKDRTTGKADESSKSGTTVSAGEPVVYSGGPPKGGSVMLL